MVDFGLFFVLLLGFLFLAVDLMVLILALPHCLSIVLQQNSFYPDLL